MSGPATPFPRLDSLDGLAFGAVVSPNVAPAAAVASAAYDGHRWVGAVGAAGRACEHDAAPDTPFDLASITKSFVAVTASLAHRAGLIRLDEPLASFEPGLPGPSLELLLSHRAGLEAHLEFFAPLVHRRPFHRASALARALRARRPECGSFPPGEACPPLYSDLGYLLAGEALERAAGLPLDQLVERYVGAPLRVDVRSARQWLAVDARFMQRVAPTETVAFRGGRVRGVVHDENAWAFAGHGTAGHAGLFGTVEGVLRFGIELVDALAGRSPRWTPHDIEPLVRPRPGGSLRMGFDGKAEVGSSAGNAASALTFGHLGFTGTSFWCDPERQRVSVLLTNRVCPSRRHLAIRATRPLVHQALFTTPLGDG